MNKKSPCCKATIDASLGDGVLIGRCKHCGTMVSRLNPKTGRLEWLDGESPWTNEDLRSMDEN